MNASRFRSMRGKLFFAAVLVSPVTSLAQSDSKSFRNNYSVSVQDLKMGRKGHAAFDKGSRLLEKGDAANSIAYLEQAIAEYPEHYKAYYDLGVARFRLGRFDGAEQAFQKAIDLTGGNFAPPQFGLGAILCQKQEFSQAAALLQRAVDLEPGSAIGKYYLGWAQFGLNRLVESEKSTEQALLRNPNFAEAYVLLARIHQRQNNAPGVAKDLEEYSRITPNKDFAHRLAEKIQREMAQDTATTLVTAIRP